MEIRGVWPLNVHDFIFNNTLLKTNFFYISTYGLYQCFASCTFLFLFPSTHSTYRSITVYILFYWLSLLYNIVAPVFPYKLTPVSMSYLCNPKLHCLNAAIFSVQVQVLPFCPYQCIPPLQTKPSIQENINN